MTTLSFSSVGFTNMEARVHDRWLFDDETILVEFTDILAGIGITDFCCFVWIEPDFAFAAVEDFCDELLL
jgi:hypothetical protein